jgi:RNA polymerase sigma factor for flagellar operon FliA
MDADEYKELELYKQQGEDAAAAHERLCERYLPFVKRIVGRMEIYFGDGALDRSDLYHAGVIGLIDAIEKFDLSRNIEFMAYAQQRVRGAVYDELRALDGLSPRARRQKKEINKTREELQNRFLRPPTDEETAEELGLSLDRFYNLQAELETTRASNHCSEDSENELITYSDRPATQSLQPWLPEADGLSPNEKFKYLANKIDQLPDRVKIILGLYYRDNLTLKEISEIMHLTESRICQIHAAAIEQLHTELSGLKKMFVNR